MRQPGPRYHAILLRLFSFKMRPKPPSISTIIAAVAFSMKDSQLRAVVRNGNGLKHGVRPLLVITHRMSTPLSVRKRTSAAIISRKSLREGESRRLAVADAAPRMATIATALVQMCHLPILKMKNITAGIMKMNTHAAVIPVATTTPPLLPLSLLSGRLPNQQRKRNRLQRKRVHCLEILFEKS
mmetsp:Transcript_1218/g.1702  ORF Transcript_1218/g.1702 Transcript_1218/m.1702 type:complete len:184 (+) Transcript_1218:200-751(+)